MMLPGTNAQAKPKNQKLAGSRRSGARALGVETQTRLTRKNEKFQGIIKFFGDKTPY